MHGAEAVGLKILSLKRASVTSPTTFRGEGGLCGREIHDPSIDRSALQVRLRALSVPSDSNRSPRGHQRGCYLGGSGSGEVVKASGRSEGIHQGTRDRSERSTSPDPLGPMDTSSISRGSLRGRGRP